MKKKNVYKMEKNIPQRDMIRPQYVFFFFLYSENAATFL